MKAVCWCGRGRVQVEGVPDPKILNPRDAVVRVTRTAICGSDLHLYDGYIPTMRAGDILGHEFMGEVDPTFIISHRLRLDEAPWAYRTFRDKEDGCTKVVLRP